MPLDRTFLATLAAGLVVASPAQAIVGGHDASPGEYPYVAHILIDRSFQCTGTLVTRTHVVTAAHCSSLVPGGVANVPLGQPGQLIEVSLGAHRTPSGSLTGYESEGEKHVARSVSVSPGWAGLGSVSGDAAVVELDSPSALPPVKIASAAERSLWSPGTLATIAGYGVTESGGEQPAVLQEAQVPIATDAVAAAAYPYLVEGVDPLFGGFESRTQVAAGRRARARTAEASPQRRRGVRPRAPLRPPSQSSAAAAAVYAVACAVSQERVDIDVPRSS
jgi:hypothetical protein